MKLENRQELVKVGVLLEEVDGKAISFSVTTGKGPVQIMADLERLENVLVLYEVHVSGVGLNLRRIREVAHAFGVAENVSEVVVQGSRRVSGRLRGKVPSILRIKVRT